MPVQAMEIKVLLIEDDSADRLWVERLLQAYPDARFSFSTAASLGQALGQIDSAFFDVVLLDLNLPDSHGGETVLRTLMHTAKTPLIIFSGNRNQRLTDSALDRGVYAYLVKELGAMDLLAQTLHRAVLDRRAAQAEEAEKSLPG